MALLTAVDVVACSGGGAAAAALCLLVLVGSAYTPFTTTPNSLTIERRDIKKI